MLGLLYMIFLLNMTNLDHVDPYGSDLVDIPIQEDRTLGVSVGSPVQNAKVGGLKGDLWLDDNGQTVVNDSDWMSFDGDRFSRVDGTSISFTGLTLDGKVFRGTKALITVGASDYPFYVKEVDSGTVEFYPSANDIPASPAIGEVRFTNIGNPSEWSSILYCEVSVAGSGSMTVTPFGTGLRMDYDILDGNNALMYFDWPVAIGGTASTTITITTPFENLINGSYYSVIIDENGSLSAGVARVLSSSPNGTITLEKLSGANFATTGGSYTTQISFTALAH